MILLVNGCILWRTNGGVKVVNDERFRTIDTNKTHQPIESEPTAERRNGINERFYIHLALTVCHRSEFPLFFNLFAPHTHWRFCVTQWLMLVFRYYLPKEIFIFGIGCHLWHTNDCIKEKKRPLNWIETDLHVFCWLESCEKQIIIEKRINVPCQQTK